MSIEGFDFEKLIQPVGSDTFFGQYWEQKPLYIQGRDPAYYSSLLSQQDLDHIISSTDMRYPALKLVQRGSSAFWSPDVYTSTVKHGSDTFSGVPDIDKVYAEYRAGATICLPGLERIWEPLRQLCMTLETYFDHAVRVNSYITSENCQGFGPHYDTHEVFVMQIAGEKDWRVYDSPVALPLVSQPFSNQPFARNYTPPPPLLEVNLKPGDLLYLPRGYIHAAGTSGTFSAHATIGVTVYTWIELAAELFMSSMAITRFRQALPPGFAGRAEDRQALREGLTELLEELKSRGEYDQMIDRFMARVSSNRLRGKGSFRCDASVESPDNERRPGQGKE